MNDLPPVRVGLVGAGPWAALFTAPLLAAGPHCTLTAVWARRHAAASTLAARHGAAAADTFEALLEGCDAVAFAVPPDVQAGLAARAAAAGRAVLLEKPLAIELADAERLAEAVAATGVVSQIVLTNRYLSSMRSYLDAVASFGPIAARATFIGGGAVAGGHFATPWRLEHGALFDLGPHVLDALDACLGPIVAVDARGDTMGVVALTCTHESGATSQATLSVTTPVDPSGLTVEVYGPSGRLTFDGSSGAVGAEYGTAMSTLTSEFAAAVRTGTPPSLDVRRGVHLQRLIDAAARQLR